MKRASTSLTLIMLVGFMSLPPLHANAAGRTYVSQDPDKEKKVLYETCRLRKAIRTEGSTQCVYKRQSGGKDAVVTVDSEHIRCQSEFKCKRE